MSFTMPRCPLVSIIAAHDFLNRVSVPPDYSEQHNEPAAVDDEEHGKNEADSDHDDEPVYEPTLIDMARHAAKESFELYIKETENVAKGKLVPCQLDRILIDLMHNLQQVQNESLRCWTLNTKLRS